MQWWLGVTSFHLRGIKRLRDHLATGMEIKSNELFLSSAKSSSKKFRRNAGYDQVLQFKIIIINLNYIIKLWR